MPLMKLDGDSKRQRIKAWNSEASEILTPLITEYAQAISRVDATSNALNASLWFEPNVILVDSRHGDDSPRASCRFWVDPSGSWGWRYAPSWHSTDDPSEKVDTEAVRTRLTNLLSGAMASTDGRNALVL